MRKLSGLTLSAAILALAALLNGSARGGAPRSLQAASSRAQEIADYFHRPVEDVNHLRGQGFGYGEIVKILVIARMSGQTLAKLLERHAQGYGWGTISRELGLDVVKVKKNVQRTRERLNIRVRHHSE